MKNIINTIVSSTNLSKQEAWWMLESITNKPKEQLMLQSDQELTSKQQYTIQSWIAKLSEENAPLAYLIGSVPFIDLSIEVQPPILIPRPETEEWIFKVIELYKPYETSIKKILDIGTGSGCIALALAKHFPQADVTAVDINPQALALAKKNAKHNNIKNITFIESNLFASCKATDKFDLIVSNPPYIDPDCKKDIMPEVKAWEDNQALFTENQGMYIIEKILQESKNHLTLDKRLPYQLIFEHDINQKKQIESISAATGWNCLVQKDLFGKYRTSWCTTK